MTIDNEVWDTLLAGGKKKYDGSKFIRHCAMMLWGRETILNRCTDPEKIAGNHNRLAWELDKRQILDGILHISIKLISCSYTCYLFL